MFRSLLALSKHEFSQSCNIASLWLAHCVPVTKQPTAQSPLLPLAQAPPRMVGVLSACGVSALLVSSGTTSSRKGEPRVGACVCRHANGNEIKRIPPPSPASISKGLRKVPFVSQTPRFQAKHRWLPVPLLFWHTSPGRLWLADLAVREPARALARDRTDRDGQGCPWLLETGAETEVRFCRERQGLECCNTPRKVKPERNKSCA